MTPGRQALPVQTVVALRAQAHIVHVIKVMAQLKPRPKEAEVLGHSACSAQMPRPAAAHSMMPRYGTTAPDNQHATAGALPTGYGPVC